MAHQKYKNKDGVIVPSVTTIIDQNLGWNKGILLNWYAKMFREGKDPTKIKTDAASIGTLCHEYIEAYILGKDLDIISKDVYNTKAIIIAESAIEQFKKAVDEHEIEFLETELPLVSETYQYGGCLDFLYKRPGIKCGLGDNKTSNGIYSEYFIQLGGYDNMVKEKTEYVPEEFLIVKISKDVTKPEDEIIKLHFIPKEKIYLGFEVFKDLRRHHDIKKELVL